MDTLLLLSLLLPGSLPASPAPELHEAVTLPADSHERIVIPLCNPPPFGTWLVVNDCVMAGNRTAPDDVLVLAGATLTLAVGAVLDVDFATHKLLIDVGSRVLVSVGARIH